MGEWASLVGLGGVAVIVGLVGLARAWGLPARYAPGAAVILGVLWNVALAPLVADSWYPLGLQGVLAGLAAAGLYDNGQAVARVVRSSGNGERDEGIGPY